MTAIPPRPMAQFEVIPTRSGWRLVEWPDELARLVCFQPRHIKFMDWPPLRSMSNINRQTP